MLSASVPRPHARRRARLLEGRLAAVVAEHHREAGGAAVGGLHLLHVRHAAAAATAHAAQRGDDLGERGVASLTGTSACRAGSRR